LWNTKLEVRAVLDEHVATLRKVLDLKVGDTLLLDAAPEGGVTLTCGAVKLSEGRVGRIGHTLAVRIERAIAQTARNQLTRIGGPT